MRTKKVHKRPCLVPGTSNLDEASWEHVFAMSSDGEAGSGADGTDEAESELSGSDETYQGATANDIRCLARVGTDFNFPDAKTLTHVPVHPKSSVSVHAESGGGSIASIAGDSKHSEVDAFGACDGNNQAPSFASSPSQNRQPRTGMPHSLLQLPSFSRVAPEDPDPLYKIPANLFDEIVRHEADRLERPQLAKNRTVYDSVEASLLHGQPVDDASSPAAAFTPPCPGEATFLAGVRNDFVPDLPRYYEPSGPQDTTLIFESRFESGNLRRAVQVYDYEYDLIMNPDYNAKSQQQWYFFRVQNTRKDVAYRFNIINFVKPTSTYNDGMRPLCYSSIEADNCGVGWFRCGESIMYYQNGIRQKEKGGKSYYTLTFTVTLPHDHDTVFFAHCYPYTYSDLQNDLRNLEQKPNMHKIMRRRQLCETLAGNTCDLITITSFQADAEQLRARRAVVITARVHPGESNASWIMKGMLDYLTSDSLDARILRDNFAFKIIPMLNPDGVVVGNYRCSLVGHDLNRCWSEPNRRLHPTIFFAKSMIRQLIEDRDVILYVDIHGHSRKKNVFMYGNSNGSSLREKVFPALLSKSSDCFSFSDCCFKMQKSKESTARVVAFRELGVVNSYTLEASFCGADVGPLAGKHFTMRHLEEMGYMVCDAILDFCDPNQSKVGKIMRELEKIFIEDGNSDDVSDSGGEEVQPKKVVRPDKKVRRKASRKRTTGGRSAPPRGKSGT